MAKGEKRVRKFRSIAQLTPDEVEKIRKEVNKLWQPVSRVNMPPHGMMVLIRVDICKGMIATYTGKFRYDVEDCVEVGGTSTPIPLNKAKHHGIVAWMPIPN